MDETDTCDHCIFLDDARAEYYCDKCGLIIDYHMDFSAENVNGIYDQRFVYKKPKPSRTKKMFDKLNIQYEMCDMHLIEQIEYKLKQILNGKISRGQVLRSLMAVCYLKSLPNVTQASVQKLFQVDLKYFNQALERYDETFKEEEP